MIGRSGILPSGLSVMASFTQWTPVAPVPEQLLIATVRNNMIHHRGLCVSAVLPALLTQGVRLEELFGCLTPCAIVSPSAGRPYFLRVLGSVFLTVLCSCWDESRTARVLAWCVRFGGHAFFSSLVALNKDVGEVEKKASIAIF